MDIVVRPTYLKYAVMSLEVLTSAKGSIYFQATNSQLHSSKIKLRDGRVLWRVLSAPSPYQGKQRRKFIVFSFYVRAFFIAMLSLALKMCLIHFIVTESTKISIERLVVLHRMLLYIYTSVKSALSGDIWTSSWVLVDKEE